MGMWWAAESGRHRPESQLCTYSLCDLAQGTQPRAAPPVCLKGCQVYQDSDAFSSPGQGECVTSPRQPLHVPRSPHRYHRALGGPGGKNSGDPDLSSLLSSLSPLPPCRMGLKNSAYL